MIIPIPHLPSFTQLYSSSVGIISITRRGIVSWIPHSPKELVSYAFICLVPAELRRLLHIVCPEILLRDRITVSHTTYTNSWDPCPIFNWWKCSNGFGKMLPRFEIFWPQKNGCFTAWSSLTVCSGMQMAHLNPCRLMISLWCESGDFPCRLLVITGR